MADLQWTESGAFEVAPGVHRIPLPLPNDGLRAVNVYAIEDGDGLVLIDSGWALEEARGVLESALAEIDHGLDQVTRFLCTHAHRDHYTLALTVRRLFGAKVSIGIGERPSIERIVAGRDGLQGEELARWGAAGIRDELEAQRALFEGSSRTEYELPDEWIPGEVDIELAKRTLRALPTPGHTQGHLVFLDPESSLLFAGDHVLPHITPSIGFEPVRATMPLGDYLDSLALVRAYPDMRLLPAHGPVAPSVHARVDELVEHHEQRLAETVDAVRSGATTALQTARVLGWTRRRLAFDGLDLFNRLLAVGETAAHLDLLVKRGVLARSEVDGVRGYTVA